ncbi:MAG: DUF805 domain-containing protein [Pikeienuella sp.]
MNMKQAVGVCLSKYVTFSGRASRAEYWWFALAVWLCLVSAFFCLSSKLVAGLSACWALVFWVV